jgi:queuine tRNA-ribosyltransferase
MPTRNARNGMVFTTQGIINIRNKKWEKDFSPLDANGDSFVDSYYSKSYVRHLFQAGEMLGPMIVSSHNLRFYLRLVETAREKIINGDFTAWKNQMLPKLSQKI